MNKYTIKSRLFKYNNGHLYLKCVLLYLNILGKGEDLSDSKEHELMKNIY